MPWIWRGLRNGIVTTAYPRRPDPYADGFPGAIGLNPETPATDVQDLTRLCPTSAISPDDAGGLRVDRGRCILCGHCTQARPDVFHTVPGTQTAVTRRTALVVPQQPESEDEETLAALRQALAQRTRRFRRSLHIRHVDAGSDGSDEWEIHALTNPVYDLHRLGMFFTASPRHADVLLVTGAGSRGMAAPLARTHQATAQPLVVIAAGTDACSGGMFASSYATHAGIADLLPVDIWVPGSPPSPFSLLHALLLAAHRLPLPAPEER